MFRITTNSTEKLPNKFNEQIIETAPNGTGATFQHPGCRSKTPHVGISQMQAIPRKFKGHDLNRNRRLTLRRQGRHPPETLGAYPGRR